MKNYKIYVDGSCRGNGNGGIGIVWLNNGEKVFEYSKGYINTTNNRMELLAIYLALHSIKKPIDSLEIVSDSEYSLGVLTNESWNPKKNVALIMAIKHQINKTQGLVKNPIKWTHTNGHASDDSENTLWNNYADKLAQNESIMVKYE